MTYSPPSSAVPFTLNVPDQDLNEWRQLLQLSKLGPTTYENTQTTRDFGITQKWLSETKDYWLNSYSWRDQEKYINSFPHYKLKVEDIDVHFIGLFSAKKDAVPIIFMHGWPGSFVEFLPMLEIIKKQWSTEDLPYHIIVPSLPGYTLSSGGPVDRDWTMVDTARVMNTLMIELGFTRYLAQGGDVGCFEARFMVTLFEECVGMHVNMFVVKEQPDASTLSAEDQKLIQRGMQWRASGMAYAMEHATRPSTIGHVLSSNPLALLAWIGEKFIEWSDETPHIDHILTNISLYWFTNGYPRSIYPYRQLFAGNRNNGGDVKKPTGVSFFPKEISPVFKEAVEKEANLVFYKRHEGGGHFAALEKPQELWNDVQEYVAKVWKV